MVADAPPPCKDGDIPPHAGAVKTGAYRGLVGCLLAAARARASQLAPLFAYLEVGWVPAG